MPEPTFGALAGLKLVCDRALVMTRYCQIRFPRRMSNRRVVKKWRKNKKNWGMQTYERDFIMGDTYLCGPTRYAFLMKKYGPKTE